MKLDELIQKLYELQAEGHGDLTVLAYDGMDPSDLEPVQYAERTSAYFFDEKGGATRPCIRILT